MLPTVMILTILMAITVLGVLSLWDMETHLFSRINHVKSNRGYVDSGFVLYESHPEIIDETGNVEITIFDSLATSTVKFEKTMWGLYEIVSASLAGDGFRQTRLLGLSNRDDSGVSFYYANDGAAITLTGNTNIKGRIMASAGGLMYGQIRSVFFSGEEISPVLISVSDPMLPAPSPDGKENIDTLFSLYGSQHITEGSISNDFYGYEPLVIHCDNVSDFYSISGNIILTGDELHLGNGTLLNDAIVVADKIVIEDGFCGSGQFFARDSLIVGQGARLLYPSGVYSQKYAELKRNSVVEGYVIVDRESSNGYKLDYLQSRYAKVRGLLYINGNAQLQGIVSGQCYIKKAVYYAPEGYYRNMIYDASVLENRDMPLPVWVAGAGKRETIKWLE